MNRHPKICKYTRAENIKYSFKDNIVGNLNNILNSDMQKYLYLV